MNYHVWIMNIRKKLFAVALLIAVAMPSLCQNGKWNFYLSYYEATDIQPAGNMIYVLASGALYSYNTADQSIYEYSQGNGLSSNSIQHIAWCNAARQLVIVYDNLDIDLLDQQGNITNLSSYKNKNTTDSKSINDIFVEGSSAYLATGFGVVKINVQKQVIENTYRMGINISQIAAINGTIYALSADNNAFYIGNPKLNLIDSNNWKEVKANVCKKICVNDGKIFGFWEKRDTMQMEIQGSMRKVVQDVFQVNQYNFANNSVSLTNIMELKNDPVRTIYYTPPSYKLIVSGGHIVFYYNGIYHDVTPSGTQNLTIEGIDKLFYDTMHHCYWASSAEDQSLQQLQISNAGDITVTATGIKANGPKYNYYFSLKEYNGNILGTDGGLSGNPVNWMSETLGRKACIQMLRTDGTWLVFDDNVSDSTKINYSDICDADVDPLDSTHVAACSRSGVYEFRNGKFFKHWTIKNSPLKSALSTNLQYVEVNGVKFDNQGNLYVLNGYVDNVLLRLNHDGTWESVTPQELIDLMDTYLRNPRHPQFDSKGRLWFCIDHGWLPAIYCYNLQTQELLSFQKPFMNQDGNTINVVDGIHAIKLDKDDNVWIGTDVGLFELPVDQQRDGAPLTQIKVARNDGTNFADYLLADINILSIAVDQANRKWIGTNGNGVYLVNSDNTEVLQHFTTADSPILSDVVESIAINHKRGEVFFGTYNGLCSYMSDVAVTYDELVADNVYAYPNPVTPEYNGQITITGLAMNTDVKIVTPNGTLVAQGRSTGGNFIWDGCDKNGDRVASGVYMVLTATSEGKKGVVCKIAIVR